MTQRRKGATIKFISALCMGILLFTGCGEPNLDDPKVREKVLDEAMDASYLQTRQIPSGEKLRYAPNQEQPYTGWVKSGRSLVQFQRGELHGLYITWYRNQQNSEKGVFKGGRIDGLWTEWYENGQKSEEGTYKNGNRDGAWIFWHGNGQKSSEGTYEADIKDGPWAEWHENGQKSSEGNYTSGSKDGLWTEWYVDGTEKSKGAYNVGIKDDAWVFWYKNGHKSSEGNYKDKIKDGLWTEWYADGTEKSKINYREGMALIPAGEFQMGSNDSDADDGEKPVHTAYVDAFYMDVYEVANAQYKKFVDANPQWDKDRIPSSYHDGDYLKHWNGNNYPSGKGNHPVIYVSWYGAMAYAEWAGKRLPTEAEWEKAARGGLVGKRYPWGNSINSSRANYGSNVGGTTPVGSYPPNGYGLYDMVGNVWEWCLDAYDSDFYKKSPRRNPIGGVDSITHITSNFTNVKWLRVLHGGAWLFSPRNLRVATRFRSNPTVTNSYYGFRCARSVSP